MNLDGNSMGLQPLVTIGLPVYNGARTVADAIRSVLAQTYQRWELIVINDGSTDSTIEIVKQFNDPRIIVHDSSDNLGLPARLNQIAEFARGEFVARLDADDLLHPARIKKQAQYLLENQSIDVIGCGMYLIDNDNKVTGVRRARPVEHTVRSALKRAPMAHATVMARREWFRTNPYDEGIRRAQDRELWCRTITSSRFSNLPEPLYYCREAGGLTPREYFRKYVRNQESRLDLLSRYGEEHMPKLERWLDVLASHFKSEVYRVCSLCGIHALQLFRTHHALDKSIQHSAQAVLDSVRQS